MWPPSKAGVFHVEPPLELGTESTNGSRSCWYRIIDRLPDAGTIYAWYKTGQRRPNLQIAKGVLPQWQFETIVQSLGGLLNRLSYSIPRITLGALSWPDFANF